MRQKRHNLQQRTFGAYYYCYGVEMFMLLATDLWAGRNFAHGDSSIDNKAPRKAPTSRRYRPRARPTPARSFRGERPLFPKWNPLRGSLIRPICSSLICRAGSRRAHAVRFPPIPPRYLYRRMVVQGGASGIPSGFCHRRGAHNSNP